MIARETLEQKVIKIVQDTLALTNPPKLNHSFREDLDADSHDFLTLLVSLEYEFEAPFDHEELARKGTLISVVDFIERALAKN